jgi:hypothetical protein
MAGMEHLDYELLIAAANARHWMRLFLALNGFHRA